MLLLEQEKLQRHMDGQEKLKLKKLRQPEKTDLEMQQQNTEKMELDLEQTKLQLIREDKFSLRWGGLVWKILLSLALHRVVLMM